MKKIFFLISIIFIYSCGYSPLYLEGKKDMLINLKEIKGDTGLNNYIKNDLKIISNNKSENIFNIDIETKYQKIILTKDATGEATDYELELSVKFTIISEKNKELNYDESFKIKNTQEKFEQLKYEKEIKRNFSEVVTNKLALYLSTLE